jgi:hypothetical protein
VLESQGPAAAARSYLPISHHCRRMPRTAAAAPSPWSALAVERPPTRPRGRCSLTPRSRYCPVVGAPQHRSLPFATGAQPINRRAGRQHPVFSRTDSPGLNAASQILQCHELSIVMPELLHLDRAHHHPEHRRFCGRYGATVGRWPAIVCAPE